MQDWEIPNLYVESDMMDPRVVSEAQLKNRSDAFFEWLDSRQLLMVPRHWTSLLDGCDKKVLSNLRFSTLPAFHQHAAGKTIEEVLRTPIGSLVIICSFV